MVDYLLSDNDECLGLNPCHVNAYCNNTVGSFRCTCDERHGYFGNGSHCIRMYDLILSLPFPTCSNSSSSLQQTDFFKHCGKMSYCS